MYAATLIIVNWNGRQFLKDCLDAVMAQTFTDFEVIVVDNGSSDDSVNFIRENYPCVKIVCLDENRGFTGGNCAGFEVAQGHFIALLNNDTRVEPAWLGELVSVMHAQPDVGICASKIIIEGTELIDSVGDLFTTAFSGTKVGHLQSASLFDPPHEIHGGCAAAILYRRSMLEKIGFLDDDFFFNHEDTDLNLRAWLAGWRCQYVPAAIVHHKVSASIGELSEKGVYYFSRNSEWVWLKNVPLYLMIFYLPHRILYEIASFSYFCILKRRWLPFFRGKRDAMKKLLVMLHKRRQVQRLIVRHGSEIQGRLVPLRSYFLKRLSSRD